MARLSRILIGWFGDSAIRPARVRRPTSRATRRAQPPVVRSFRGPVSSSLSRCFGLPYRSNRQNGQARAWTNPIRRGPIAVELPHLRPRNRRAIAHTENRSHTRETPGTVRAHKQASRRYQCAECAPLLQAMPPIRGLSLKLSPRYRIERDFATSAPASAAWRSRQTMGSSVHGPRHSVARSKQVRPVSDFTDENCGFILHQLGSLGNNRSRALLPAKNKKARPSGNGEPPPAPDPAWKHVSDANRRTLCRVLVP